MSVCLRAWDGGKETVQNENVLREEMGAWPSLLGMGVTWNPPSCGALGKPLGGSSKLMVQAGWYLQTQSRRCWEPVCKADVVREGAHCGTGCPTPGPWGLEGEGRALRGAG